MEKRLAVIRIAGTVGVNRDLKDTFSFIRLYNKYTCVVLPSTKIYLGMIMKLNNYITWGEINKDTFKLLIEKRGKITKKEKFSEEYLKKQANTTIEKFSEEFMNFKKEIKDIPGLKNFFKLCPPRGGFENNGTKKPYSLGGALGYRKEKINELISKMV